MTSSGRSRVLTLTAVRCRRAMRIICHREPKHGGTAFVPCRLKIDVHTKISCSVVQLLVSYFKVSTHLDCVFYNCRCAWTFGITYLANGAHANMKLGNLDYLIQQAMGPLYLRVSYMCHTCVPQLTRHAITLSAYATLMGVLRDYRLWSHQAHSSCSCHLSSCPLCIVCEQNWVQTTQACALSY